MTFHCEFCGMLINTETDKKCPNCGASFSKNKINKSLEEKRIKQENLKIQKEETDIEYKRAQIEKQKIVNETHKNNLKTQKKIAKIVKITTGIIVFPIIAFVVVIGLAILIGLGSAIYQAFDEPKETNKIEEFVEPEIIEKDVSVNFLEKGFTSKYSVMVDEAIEINPYPWTPPKGYRHVAFHFVVENISDKDFRDESKVVCSVNGIKMSSTFGNDWKGFKNQIIPSGFKIDGYLFYEIPIDLETVQLKYGDYITINIKNDQIAPRQD